MDSFVDYAGQAGRAHFQHLAEGAGECGSQSSQAAKQSPESAGPDPHKTGFYNPNLTHAMSCEVKPRLTKEQHDILEAQFQKQNKPNTQTKKTFAESLNVSLDKVNNWFQNRRAKSKQDAKKAAGAMNLFAAQHQANQLHYSSDSDVSPAFPSSDYFSMMQQCTPDEQMPNGLGISQMGQFHDQYQSNGLPFFNGMSGAEQYPSFSVQHHQDMFDSPEGLNRRTLTQEQFDAITAAQSNGIMSDSSTFDMYASGFSSDPSLGQIFPELFGGKVKRQEAFSFPHPVGAPLSSQDSTIHSSISEQSITKFPSPSSIQEQAAVSANSSIWGGSRSSSVSATYPEDHVMHASTAQQQPAATTSQWQPGQSVPVDFNAHMEAFRQVSQTRQSPKVSQAHEQPLAFPTDGTFIRRDSTGSMLAQSMSNVGLQTPQNQRADDFKTPATPTSIAARRQRPRPAALGIASLRSQSYSGNTQPGSPGQAQLHSASPAGQPLRRIRSSNVINSVTQGRISKNIPGSAQRSPLSWTFTNTTHSPKVARHTSSQSTSNLAPPTPMSPQEFPMTEQPRQQIPIWQSASGHANRQPRISESEEHGLTFVSSGSVDGQPSFSSPPHTPLYLQQNFTQHRVGSQVITENTPPQSAPASQSCFPANTFTVSQPQLQAPMQSQAQASSQHHAQPFVPSQQQLMNVMVPEPQFRMPNATVVHSQPLVVPTTSVSSDIPMHFVNGAPIVNDRGQLVMAFPQPMHTIPHHQQQQQLATPPQVQYPTFTTATGAPTMQVSVQIPKQQHSTQPAPEFFVHEYTPPQDIKRAVTPRKTTDTGPRNYTFTNHGPEYFENGKKGSNAKASATASSSPASSNEAASAS